MRIPVATYRVQFNDDYRFEDARRIIPQLHGLGVSHLYASPIFAARHGSKHGYDVVDPNRLNPSLGTAEEFDALVRDLLERGMGLLIDIVPNHMAASTQNAWWLDLLENGKSSRYAEYFGVNWDPDASDGGQILLPILGSPYGTALENQEMRVSLEQSGLVVNYYETKLPIAPRTWDRFLGECGDLPNTKEALWERYSTDTQARLCIDQAIEAINGVRGNPNSFDALDRLLGCQAYRLAYWRTAPEKINYRRFFDVADLVGVRVEESAVFDESHALVLDLVKSGKVEGLRVDHIDGLLDPFCYLERLASNTGVYTVVEKILSDNENLPQEWPVQGTTGYDFAGTMNGLFIEADGLAKLTAFYNGLTGSTRTLADVEYERKKNVIAELFNGDVLTVGTQLVKIALQNRHSRDLSPKQINEALTEITACMPVYRTYANSLEPRPDDVAFVQQAVAEARQRNPEIPEAVYGFVSQVLMLRFPESLDEARRLEWLRFVVRWQQMTGPIMAKGVEDSSFYVYNRLVSMNEVGTVAQAMTPAACHAFLEYRQKHWPYTMNASSTHDTKRSEDVRARINVISEVPEVWFTAVERWLRAKPERIGKNEAYLLFQNLLGAWPLGATALDGFTERMKEFAVKAAREARVHTSWLNENREHEDAVQAYVASLIEDPKFRASLDLIHRRTSFYGAINSLSQVLLKITAPGLPDFYRGAIGWDFSLVDPDNRRPYTFEGLTEVAARGSELMEHWPDGQVKVFLTGKALAFRNAFSVLFERGGYNPLVFSGKRSQNVFGFARRHGSDWAMVIVPRFASQLSARIRVPVGFPAWRDTVLELSDEAPANWQNVLTGASLKAKDGALAMSRICSEFPVALLRSC